MISGIMGHEAPLKVKSPESERRAKELILTIQVYGDIFSDLWMTEDTLNHQINNSKINFLYFCSAAVAALLIYLLGKGLNFVWLESIGYSVSLGTTYYFVSQYLSGFYYRHLLAEHTWRFKDYRTRWRLLGFPAGSPLQLKKAIDENWYLDKESYDYMVFIHDAVNEVMRYEYGIKNYLSVPSKEEYKSGQGYFWAWL